MKREREIKCEHVCSEKPVVGNRENSESKVSNLIQTTISAVWISPKLCKEVVKPSLHRGSLVRKFKLSAFTFETAVHLVFFNITNYQYNIEKDRFKIVLL